MSMWRAQQWWQGLGRIVIAAVTCAVLLIWLGMSRTPDSHALQALLLYLPYPVYLLPALVAVGWSGWMGWGWRLLSALTLLFVLTVLMGLTWGRPDQGAGPVRLMTYNAKAYLASYRPRGFWELAEEVQRHNPDVLVMQDAGQLMDLKVTQPAVFKALFGERQVYGFDQYIVASRLPLKDCQPGWLPDFEQARAYVHCVLTAHGQEVDLITVHFVTPRDGLNATRSKGLKGLSAWRQNMNNRVTQSGDLAEQLRLMNRPRIVAGDLNAPERSVVVQDLLNTGMRDAFSSAGTGYGYTHGHSLWPGISFLRIDHILVSGQIGVRAAFAGGAIASQHRPVITDLFLTRQ
jgi:endonuclease/exonuclease/phosphatase (EEP) superfamily protein YafD